MPAEVVVRAIAAGAFRNTLRDVVARNNGCQRFFPRESLRHRAHSGNHDGARMTAAAEIVELERVTGGAVDERSLRCRKLGVLSPKHARAGLGAERTLH